LTDVLAGCTTNTNPSQTGYLCQVANPNFLASQTTSPATLTLVDKFTSIILTAVINDTPAPGSSQTVSSAIIGQTVQFTAVVTVPPNQGTGLPNGKVTFYDTEEVTGTQRILCSAMSLSGSSITCVTTAAAVPANTLLVGSHRISAVFTGDATSGNSTATSIGFNVLKGTVTVTVDDGLPATPTISGQFVTHTVTISVNSPASGVPTGTVSLNTAVTPAGGATTNYALACGTLKPASPFTLKTGTTSTYTTKCTVVNYNSPANSASHVVSATYNGDNFFAAGTNTNTPTTRVVTTAPSAIALSASIGNSVAVNTNNWNLIATLSWAGPTGSGAVATPIPIGHGFFSAKVDFTVTIAGTTAAVTGCNGGSGISVVQYINDQGVASYQAVCPVSIAQGNLQLFTAGAASIGAAIAAAVPDQAVASATALPITINPAQIRAVVTSADLCGVAGGVSNPTFRVDFYPVPPSVFSASAVVPNNAARTPVWSADVGGSFCTGQTVAASTPVAGLSASYSVTCTPTTLAQGLRKVQAAWGAGDANFVAPAASVAYAMTMSTAAFPTTTIVSTPACPGLCPVAGQSTKLVLTVAGNPTGTMSFYQQPAGAIAAVPITSCQKLAFGTPTAGTFTCTTTELQSATTGVNYANAITALYDSPQTDTGLCQAAANTGSITINSAVIRTRTTTPVSTTNVGIPFVITAVVSVDSPGSSSKLLAGTVDLLDDLAGTNTGRVTDACKDLPLVQVAGSATATATCNFAGYVRALTATTYQNPVSGVRTIQALFKPISNFNYGQTLSGSIQQVQEPQILNVERAIPTLAVVSNNPNNVWGELVSWTATISISTGFVQGGLANVVPGGRPVGKLEFYLNGTAISACSGANALSITTTTPYTVQNTFNVNCAQTNAGTLAPALLPGANNITVIYTPDDPTLIAPTSASMTQNTAKNPTSIVLTSDVNPALTGSTFTLTALLTVAGSPGSQNGQVANTFNTIVPPLLVPTFVGLTFKLGSNALPNCQNLPLTQIASSQNQYYSTCVATGPGGSVTAVYPDYHAYFAGSTSNTVSQTMANSIATVTLTSNAVANTFGNGATITYTAVVDVVGGPTGTTLSGSVSFTDSVPSASTKIGNCDTVAIVPTSSSSGVATCTAQIFRQAKSNHVISATFNGQPNVAVGTLAVTVQAATIKMTTSSDPVAPVHAQPIRLIAYVIVDQSSNAPVAAMFPVAGYVAFYTAAPTLGSFANLVPGCSGVAVQPATTSLPCLTTDPYCVVAVCTTTVYSLGTQNFYSAFSATNTGSGVGASGDYNDAVATTALSVVISKAATSVVTVVGPNPAVVGQPITIQSILNVQLPSIGVPVPTTTTAGSSEVRIFYGSDNIVPICGAGGNGKQLFIAGTLTASCFNAVFSPGQYDIKSIYPGDVNYLGSGVSAPVTLTVLKGNTSLTLTSDVNPAIQNPSAIANTVVFRVRVNIAAPAAGSLGGEVILRVTSPASLYQGFVPTGGVATNIVVCSATGSTTPQNSLTGGISFSSGVAPETPLSVSLLLLASMACFLVGRSRSLLPTLAT